MSVRNGEAYLKACIDSILGQTFSDFEFIIVDDASTDATAVLLDEYTRADERVRLVTNKENLGLTKSLNIALQKARGEYIARMDADDISLPERFEKQVRFLGKYLSHSIVGSWMKIIDDQSKEIDVWETETSDDQIKKALIRYNPMFHPTVMMRKNLLDQIGGYDEAWRYAQDYELYFRLSRIGKMANIPEYLLRYRVSKKSITVSRNTKQAVCALRAQWKGITSGFYSPLNIVFLVRPIIGMLLPKSFKDLYKS